MMADWFIFACGVLSGVILVFIWAVIASQFDEWVKRQREQAVADYKSRQEP